MRNIQVWGLDGIEQIVPITDYTRVDVVERDLDIGAWRIDLPIGDASSAASRLLGATKPGIEVYDPETGWRFGGYLRKKSEKRTATKGTVTFTGRDFQARLAGRLDWPDVTDVGRWWITIYGGTLPATTDAHNSMYFNAGPGAPTYRQIESLALGADPAAGDPRARRIKGMPLLEAYRGLFLGSDYTCRLRLNRDISAGSAPRSELLFETPERQLAEVVLDTKTGTASEIETIDEANESTFAIAMGAEIGDGPERLVTVAQVADFTDWQNEYSETFINRPSTDEADKLNAEANDSLIDASRGRAVKVSGAEVSGYGRSIDLGWRVQVNVETLGGAEAVIVPVVGSTLSFRPDRGWRRQVDVGTHTLNGPASVQATINNLQRKIRQLEAELRY